MRLYILSWINEGHFIHYHHLLPVVDVPVDIEIRKEGKNQKLNTGKMEERLGDGGKKGGRINPIIWGNNEGNFEFIIGRGTLCWMILHISSVR